MCGILGYVGNLSDTNKFEYALSKLSHRGPDAQGIWKSENIVLGHRRLSIIDLSENASQPMSVLDRFAISLNGEIYNYKEIRSVLEKEFVFKSESDTEVLLYAFIKWGAECLQFCCRVFAVILSKL